MASSEGNQIFVTVRKGKSWPPQCVEVRVKYEQTIKDLKEKVCTKASIPPENLQLFWHGKEMTPDQYDTKTLLALNLHTGFSLMGYDLTEEPDYWPPVKKTKEGMVIIAAN